jgi:oligoribonuclease
LRPGKQRVFAMNHVNSLNLIWIDLEMTGLDPIHDRIIEIATVVTDADLNVLAEGPSMAINQAQTLLDGMDEWNTKQHGNSGLIERVSQSTISEAEASAATLNFLRQWVPEGQSPMCGNTIGQDRRFLVRYMPELAAFFHYRNLDVSTLKELARRWRPELLEGFVKQAKHLALDDVYDSIAELRYYREHFIRAEK